MQQIIVPLGVDGHKANGTVILCLHLVQLQGTNTLNDILPRLTGVEYLTLIDASSGYHNLKFNEILYLMTFLVHLASINT